MLDASDRLHKVYAMSFNLHYSPEWTLQQNANILAKELQFERIARAAKGYRFIYGAEDIKTHKRICQDFEFSCYEMMRRARDNKSSVEVFFNLNGEIAVKLL